MPSWVTFKFPTLFWGQEAYLDAQSWILVLLSLSPQADFPSFLQSNDGSAREFSEKHPSWETSRLQ